MAVRIDDAPARTSARTTPTAVTGLVDVSGVAAILGVDMRHVRRLVAERRIPFIKWGRLLRFDPVEIGAWIDERRRGVHPRK